MVSVYKEIDGKLTKIGDEVFGEFVPIAHSNETTSKEAAKSMISSADAIRNRVLEAVVSSRGATCDELECVLSLSHQTCSARIRELALMGKIKDSGLKRKTRSDRSAIVWIES